MNFVRRKLKNGMIVIMEKRELPIVVVGVANRFGAICESEKIKGVAHVLEHLLFTGTKTRTSEEISREIEKKGGMLNAFTSNEMTCFWFKLPSEHVFSGLDILSDMLINPKFDKEKFEKEKKVILEEIKMYHDDPARHVFDKIESNLYEKPFGGNVIGNKKSVSGLERDFTVSFFEENYNPKNYIISVVVNADFDKICNYFENKFKAGRGKPKPIIPVKQNKETMEEREGLDQAHFVFGAHAPLMNDEDYYALELLDAYLTYGMSSKLFMEIREKRGLAYAVKGIIQAEKSYSYYCIYVGTRKDAIDEVKRIILEEIGKVKDLKEKNLNEAKETLIGLRKITKEESSNVMNSLLSEELADKAENYYQHEKNIKKVKLSQVKRVAENMLKKYSISAIVPK